MFSRRRLIAGLALAGTAAAGRPAAALSIEPAPAAVAGQYLAACGPQADHARLLDEAAAILGEKPLPPERRRAILAALACPACGCLILPGL